MLSPEHRIKVRRCLELLQAAQSLINDAAAELCPVPGFADQWSASDKPYQAVKDYWYLVDNHLRSLTRKDTNES